METLHGPEWAAGFFDGEGCFYAHKGHPRSDGTQMFRTHAAITQKDREPLDWFHKIVGCGVVYWNTDIWAWKTTRVGQAEKVYEILRPWLSARRRETAETLLINESAQVFRPLSEKCRKGHEYTQENTRIYPNRRGRVCIMCVNDSNAKRVR